MRRLSNPNTESLNTALLTNDLNNDRYSTMIEAQVLAIRTMANAIESAYERQQSLCGELESLLYNKFGISTTLRAGAEPTYQSKDDEKIMGED